MVAESGGVVAHMRHDLQLAADLAACSGKRSSHAVVAGVQYQHRSLALAGLLPHRDHRGDACVPTRRLVVVDRQWRVVRRRSHADEVRVHVVGM